MIASNKIYINVQKYNDLLGTYNKMEEMYQTLFNSANDAIFVHEIKEDGSAGTFIEVNKLACDLLGYIKADLLNLFPKDISDINQLKKAAERKDNLQQSFEINLRTKDQRYIPVEINTQKFLFRGKQIILSIARDISERKQLEEKLKWLSIRDPLTGLNNRTFYEQEKERLNKEYNTNNKLGMIVCDLDGLKLINDTLGHHYGDKLLKAMGDILRKSCSEAEAVARIGGDEFIILLETDNLSMLAGMCQRIQAAIDQYNMDNTDFFPLNMSMGCAVKSRMAKDIDDLFREADSNMYRQKLYYKASRRNTIVQILRRALESRDFIADGHIERMQILTEKLALALQLPHWKVNHLNLLAQFHDIGKVGVPERILLNKGKLSFEEMEAIRKHSEIGYRIAQSSPDLLPIADWILMHHEWWNGMGYPFGLAGEEIPLECRILAIVDAYEAMTSDRPYRKATSKEEAVKELKRYSGIQFDPQLIKIFVTLP